MAVGLDKKIAIVEQFSRKASERNLQGPESEQNAGLEDS